MPERLSHPLIAHIVGLLVALGAGVLLVLTARAGALPLLVGIAVVQAVLAFTWVYGTDMIGRKGALALAAFAAAAADATVSVWPASRLGALLAVFGLAVPALFMHQLTRGAARSQLLISVGSIAALALFEVAPAALLQLRHEFTGSVAGSAVDGGAPGRTVVAAVVLVMACGLAVAALIDLLSAVPRFDSAVPRGFVAVLGAAGVGGSLGHLVLESPEWSDFDGGRGALIGAAIGVLAGLLAVAGTFAGHSAPPPYGVLAACARPAIAPLVAISVVSPVAFLLCLAARG